MRCIAAHQAGPAVVRAAAELVNDEWARSLSGRIRSIETSADALPASLLLLDAAGAVLAHARVSRIALAGEAGDAAVVETGVHYVYFFSLFFLLVLP